MWEKKVALVTGSNRGLGLETSRQLAKNGCSVVMLARSLEKLEKVMPQLLEEKLDVYPFELDVTNETHIKELVQFIEKQFGRADILVNNAGVFLDRKVPQSSLTVPPEIVLQTFQVNTLGPLRMCQAIIPFMKKQNYGRIVNVSSGMGQISSMGSEHIAYRISKAALNVVTRTLANELKNLNIKINSVCPGWVRTDMGGPDATRSIEEGVEGIVWAAFLNDNGPSGGFFRDKEAIEW